MLTKTISGRMAHYAPANVVEQENILQEILQHHVLASLSRSDLFREAMFHGGTCLRILFGMNRFSEDLDFLLKKPDPFFRWQRYLDAVHRDFALEGIPLEMQDKSKQGTAVQKAFLKIDAFDRRLQLDLPFERNKNRKIRIKLEIDTNPPAGSAYSTFYLTYPVTLPVTTQTLESGFALKLHALLCRSYLKGRDWYDFIWYSARRIKPDLKLLQNALQQQGPWAGKSVHANESWLHTNLKAVIEAIDWTRAREDVQRFLPLSEQEGLQAWSKNLFLQQLHTVTGASPISE